jgi:EAL domain-containing protein (putative c-di-GMP-specific phosphodiesterase class I)
VSARWTDGEDDARVDVVLRRRLVRAAFQPVVRLGTGLTAGYHATLRGPLGSPLEREDRLLTVAAHRGLRREFDDLRLATTLDAAERAKLTGPLALFVRRDVEAAATDRRAFDGAAVGFPVVVEFDAGAVTTPARIAEAAARTRAAGWRVGLANVAPDDRVTSLLGSVRPEYIGIEADLWGRDRDAFAAIVDEAAQLGSTLLASGVDTDRDAGLLRGSEIAFGYGLRFGRPDLLVRAPQVFDPAGCVAPAGTVVAADVTDA